MVSENVVVSYLSFRIQHYVKKYALASKDCIVITEFTEI
jgi:hypothetical protein